MPKKEFLSAFSVVCMIGLVSGCASRGVDVRFYGQDKVRVDQDVKGKIGNWKHAPQAVEEPDRKSTRKIYVFELSKQQKDQVTIDETYHNKTDSPTSIDALKSSFEEIQTRPSSIQKMTLPSFDDDSIDDSIPAEDKPVNQEVRFIDYKVENGDTLQKISKKFYDSYSQWPKIYEANKGKIKNPDSIQPGIVIQIPVE